MRLPLPDPRELVALGPRVLGLVGEAERLLGRVDRLVDRIDGVTDHADEVARRAGTVAQNADVVVGRVAHLLDELEPALTRLQPVLQTLSDTTDPDEVAALVRMVDHLPELTRRLEDDVLPVMTTLSSVAPDLHDLLTVSRELNEMLGKLPGLGRIKRKVEEEQEDELHEREGSSA